MWFLIPKILKHKSFQIQNPTYVFLDTPDLIKLLSRIVPELAEVNADCANAGRGAHGPAAGGGVGAWGVRGGAFEPRNLQQCVLHYYS